jgi:pyruvate formate lyase activating enzyme
MGVGSWGCEIDPQPALPLNAATDYNSWENNDMASLLSILENKTAAGELYEPMDGGRIRCFACGHNCPIPDGAQGVCKVRFNRGGVLRVPFGYVSGLANDPIEKKPFFHVLPGSSALSFGMLGCDLHCSYCQNWVTSQALRDPEAGSSVYAISPQEIIRTAKKEGSRVVVSTYNEPLITAEWSVAIFKEARSAGLMTGFVSNGNATPRALDYLRPWLDMCKVDLKSFDDSRYRKLGGRLEPILNSIRRIHASGVWLEIVTLLVPGFNDLPDELTRLAEFISGVSPDIPWHVTAFHPDYRMTDPRRTSGADLLRAVEIGRRAGLQYVYAGNLPGLLEGLENTWCPQCRSLIVERRGYSIRGMNISKDGSCPSCGKDIPGRWASI